MKKPWSMMTPEELEAEIGPANDAVEFRLRTLILIGAVIIFGAIALRLCL